MKVQKNLWRILLLGSIVLFAPLTVWPFEGRVSGAEETTFAIEPEITTKAPNELFNVTFVVTSVVELFVWEFNVTFNPEVLEAVSFFEGPFLKEVGDTWPLPESINNTVGWMGAGGSFFPPFPEHGANGTGTLAYVTFRAKAEGKSNLHFYDSKLRSWNQTSGLLTEILHTTVDGLFQYPLLRDLAITGVISSSTSVSAGESVFFNVTVMNKGNVPETFDVSLSYDSKTIETKTVTDLNPDSVDTLDFVWDTRNVASGSYVITATAVAASGETNTGDNSNSNLVVKVTAASPIIPLELLIVVIAVVAAVGAGAFLYVRRRSTKKSGATVRLCHNWHNLPFSV